MVFDGRVTLAPFVPLVAVVVVGALFTQDNASVWIVGGASLIVAIELIIAFWTGVIVSLNFLCHVSVFLSVSFDRTRQTLNESLPDCIAQILQGITRA
jgi:hypothetical protein